MLSEGSCETEDLCHHRNKENIFVITGINFQPIQIGKVTLNCIMFYNITVLLFFDQINAAFVSINLNF